jgi:hypothetical protein
MTRTFPLLLVAATLGCGGSSAGVEPLTCNAVAPTACAVEPPPRYGQIAGIVHERCVSSCHDGLDPLGPWPLTAYDDVADWNDIIRDELVACTMPPPDSGRTIPDDERQALLMWLRCGFLE